MPCIDQLPCTESFLLITNFIPGGMSRMALKPKALCTCAWADNFEFILVLWGRLKDHRAWGRSLNHRCIGKNADTGLASMYFFEYLNRSFCCISMVGVWRY